MSKNRNWKDYDYESTNESEATTMEEPTESTTGYGKVVNALWVNMRKQPTKDSRPVVTIQRGTEVEILSKVNPQWYKVKEQLADRVGYIHSDFIEEV